MNLQLGGSGGCPRCTQKWVPGPVCNASYEGSMKNIEKQIYLSFVQSRKIGQQEKHARTK